MGAGIGAGLGTVIGASTGAAGQGLLIGAAAGTIAGAAIGKYMEGNEQQTAQEEHAVLQTHKREIQEQREEVKTIRSREREERRDDLISPTNRSSAKPNLSSNEYRGNPNAVPFMVAASEPVPSRGRLATNSASSARHQPIVIAKAETKAEKSVKNLPSVKEQAIGVPAGNGVGKHATTVERTVLSNNGTLETSSVVIHDETNPPLLASGLPPAKKSSPDTELIESETKEAATVPAIEEPVAPSRVAKQASEASPEGCSKASAEAKRGEQSASASDKLFYFKRASRLCPSQASYVLKLGQVYAQLGRSEEAKKEFDRVLQLDPDNATAHEELSLLDQRIGY